MGMAKLVFGVNKSQDGYIDHMAFFAKPHALPPLHRGGSPTRRRKTLRTLRFLR